MACAPSSQDCHHVRICRGPCEDGINPAVQPGEVRQIPICAAEPILAHHSRAMISIGTREYADDVADGAISESTTNRTTGTEKSPESGSSNAVKK